MSEQASSRRGWLWGFAAVLVLAAGVAVYLLLQRLGAAEESAGPAPPPLVDTVVAESADALELTQTGFVRPRARLDVAAEVSGRIREVGANFSLGRRVAEGEMILTLEQARFEADVARASAAVQQAEAALAEAQVDRDRQQELASRDIAAEATLQQALVDVATAEADLAAARASLTQAELALDDTVVTAPFDAFVVAESAAVGALLQAGTSVGTLVAADAAQVRFGLTPEDLRLLGDPGLALGGRVAIYGDGSDVPLAEGVVDDIDPRIEAATRTVSLIVRIADPFAGERPLRIDELVELRLPVSLEGRNAVALPAEAVKANGTVWRIEDGRLRRLSVTPLQRGERRVLLAGRTLEAGERVMVSDLAAPFEGQEVRTAAEGEETPGNDAADREAAAAAPAEGG